VELEDLGACSARDKCEPLFHKFEAAWQEELKNVPDHEQRSLWRVMWKTVGFFQLFNSLLLYSGYTACGFGPILILNILVRYFEGRVELSTSSLWIFTCLMFVLPVTGSVLAAQSNIVLAHVGLAFRNVLINKIYRKSLMLSPAARQLTSTGQIVNMFSNDTQQIQRFMFFLNNCVLAPPTIGICMYLIYRLIGNATFVGLGLMVFVMPFNGFIFDALNKVRKRKVIETDKRVKLMNEILNGIRIIKYYAWEISFTGKVRELRMKELELLKMLAYITAVAFSITLMAVPIFLPVLIFYTYVRLGNDLTAATAFTTLSLFNLMQFPFVFLPLGLAQYSQVWVNIVVALRTLSHIFLRKYAPQTSQYDTFNQHTLSSRNGHHTLHITLSTITTSRTTNHT
jgi:ATP-binding cassette subfamily C (CFTR/MRP) protein 1